MTVDNVTNVICDRFAGGWVGFCPHTNSCMNRTLKSSAPFSLNIQFLRHFGDIEFQIQSFLCM
jgi:hypothetical protein